MFFCSLDCKNTLVTTTDHEMAEDSLGRGAEMDQSQPDDRRTEDSGLPDSKEHEVTSLLR